MLHEVLVAVRDAMGADTATVLLLDEGGTYLETVASVGVESAVALRFRVPVGAGFAGTIASARQPRKLDEVRAGVVVNPLLLEAGIHALVGVPLLADNDVVGVMHVGRRSSKVFDDVDVERLEAMAQPLAAAIRGRLSDEEQAAAGALQRSLLPSRLPEIPGLLMAGRYIPTAGNVGGDWYDVFTLPDERVGIVMGDVAGHGLPAAVVMGRLRSALRSYALLFDDPAQVLSALDRKAQHFEAGMMATVLYGVAEPPYAEIRLSVAGHLPPLVVKRGARATSLVVAADLPIGVDTSLPRTTHTVRLEEGSSFCTFTDGLIERRPAAGGPVVTLVDDLAGRILETFRAEDPSSTCGTLLDASFSVAPPTDDVAILVLHRVFPVP